MRATRCVLGLALVLSGLLARDAVAGGGDAPMGYRWGQPVAEISALSPILKTDKLWNRVLRLQVEKPPQSPPGTDSVVLLVDPHHGLGGVRWLSPWIGDDAEGARGIALYNEWKAVLLETYGAPFNGLEKTGIGMRSDSDQFYQCLARERCGMWATIWALPSGMQIVLEIRGSRNGGGRVAILYQGPNWPAIVDQLDLDDGERPDAY